MISEQYSWPSAPDHHTPTKPQFAEARPPVWRDPKSPATWRTCSYCGSLSVEDLIRLLDADPEVEMCGTDWKYGWPHKFYVLIPDPRRGRQVHVGSVAYTNNGKTTEEAVFAPATVLQAKFYVSHLRDSGFDPEALAYVLQRLYEETSVEYELPNVPDGRIAYRAPYKGYQRETMAGRKRNALALIDLLHKEGDGEEGCLAEIAKQRKVVDEYTLWLECRREAWRKLQK